MPSMPSRRQFLSLSGAAALGLAALPASAIVDRPASLIVWDGAGPFFGGFSAIELSEDRTTALILSDRGFVMRARLLRDAAGLLTGIEKLDHFALRDRDGGPVQGPRADAEGMDLRPDGTLFVSFEGRRRTRVMRHDTAQASAQPMPGHADWQDLPSNSGLEALAVDPTGAVLAIPETATDGGFPIYRHTAGDWSIVGHLPAADGFAPVGADFGPDGALYLLERKFRLAFFATRISRLLPGDWGQRQVLVETGYGVLDNHEGISITRDAQGQLWATTISDDNQNRFQRTELAEFPLPEA